MAAKDRPALHPPSLASNTPLAPRGHTTETATCGLLVYRAPPLIDAPIGPAGGAGALLLPDPSPAPPPVPPSLGGGVGVGVGLGGGVGVGVGAGGAGFPLPTENEVGEPAVVRSATEISRRVAAAAGRGEKSAVPGGPRADRGIGALEREK